MSNAISSLIFAYRNVGKTQNGEIGRAPVAAAQGIKVIDQVSKYNQVVAQGTDAAVSAFSKLAQESKVADYALKATKWAVHNVNPMICASGVIKVAMSDDKTTAAIRETAALSTMFAGETIAKQVLPKVPGLLEKAINHFAKNPVKIGGKAGKIIEGILFVCASIASYDLGEHLGKDLAHEVKANWAPANSQKINQIA